MFHGKVFCMKNFIKKRQILFPPHVRQINFNKGKTANGLIRHSRGVYV